MTLTELKSVIHEDVNKIDDAELLDILKIFIETHILNSKSPEFNDEQLKRLENSRDQIQTGELYANEDVDKEFDKWLKK